MSAEIKNSISLADPEIQREFSKSGWALSALSEVTAALARADSTDLLIKEVCNAIAAQSPYLSAWVGRAEDDEGKSGAVMGSADSAIGYIKNIAVSWSDQNIAGMGPGGIAIRTGKSYVVADTELDENFVSWRELARNFGIRSVVACPIFTEDMHPFGILLIYSK